mgnify:CR=1 FL=1
MRTSGAIRKAGMTKYGGSGCSKMEGACCVSSLLLVNEAVDVLNVHTRGLKCYIARRKERKEGREV